LIKLYEKVNHLPGDFKLEKQNSFTFLVLMHTSIQLVDYESQQKQQLLLQQQLLQQQQQQQQQQIQQTNSNPNLQSENYSAIKMEINESAAAPPPQAPSNVQIQMTNQINPQLNGGINANNQLNMNQNQIQQQQYQQAQPQFQQNQPLKAQQIPQHMQQQQQQQQIPPPPQAHNNTNSYNQPNGSLQLQQQHQQQLPVNNNNNNNNQADLYINKPIQNQHLQQQQQQIPAGAYQPNLAQNQAHLGPRASPNINAAGKPMQMQPQQPQTGGLRPIQPINQHIIQSSHTPPTVIVQGQQAMMQQQQNYNQPGQMIGQQNQPQQQQQQQMYPQQQQQQQQQQQSPKQTVIWDGNVEWQEKDRNNPANPNKVTHVVKAQMISSIILDQATGQYIPEVSPLLAQGWPQKIPLQLLSNQILEILNSNCVPPTRNLLLLTEGGGGGVNQELKSTLQSVNIGGALINFASNQNQEIKILLITCNGNDIVCKIPSDQNKFLNALRNIVQRQKQQQQQQQLQQRQQQQQMQQPPQPGQIINNPVTIQQQQQQQLMQGAVNPNQMQVGVDQKDLRHLLISPGPNQPTIGANGQPNINQIQQPTQQTSQNWINVGQQANVQQMQQQQQQQQQQIYMQNNQGQQQQQQQQQQQKPPQQQQNFQYYQ
jgi:mediator of RNA polymerase II transcription subunit 12